MDEPDPDGFQWTRHIFDSPVFHVGYYTTTSQPYTNNTYYGQYPMSHYGGDCSPVENDEIIAHTLQEEFSQLAMREVPVCSRAEEEDSKVSIDQHNWQTSSPRMYWSGNTYDHGEADNMWASGSSISHGYGEEYSYSQQPVDGYEYSEMDNPLNQMVPIRHVPRINGEIPSMDEATSDYERLRERMARHCIQFMFFLPKIPAPLQSLHLPNPDLVKAVIELKSVNQERISHEQTARILQLYDLIEHKVDGDGNCQFRALSDQLHKTSAEHEQVRQQIVEQLRTSRELYEGYVPMDYDEYLCKMSNNGEWGDHVTLQAAADVYAAKIFVITSFKDTCYIEILPNGHKPKQVLFLSFWAEVHYNSIYPRDSDIPVSHSGKKRGWWPFRG